MNQERTAKKVLREIKKLLYEVWDPIGINEAGGPRDEYDAYAPAIYQLLKRGATLEEIAQHLENIAQQRMGLGAGASHRVAAELICGLTRTD